MKVTPDMIAPFDIDGDHWTAREFTYMADTWRWKYQGSTMNDRALRHHWREPENMPELLRLAIVGKKHELRLMTDDEYNAYLLAVRTLMR